MHPFIKNSKENGVLNYIRVLLSISIVLSIFNPMLVASAGSVVAPALINGLSFADNDTNDDQTVITLGAPSVGSNTFVYKISTDDSAVPTPNVGDDLSTWTAVTNSASITAANGKHIGVAEINDSSLAVQFSDATAVTEAEPVFDPSYSTLAVNATTVTDGESILVTVTPKDQYNANLGSGQTVIVLLDGVSTGIDVTDVTDGTYTAVVTPVYGGTNEITATVGVSSVTQSQTITVTEAESVIATADGIIVGSTNPLINLTGTNFASDIATDDLTVDIGTTNLTLASVTLESSTIVTLVFTGTAEVGNLTVQAKTSAFNPKSTVASNILTVIVGSVEITGYDSISDVDAGTAGSATYTDATAVITHLNATYTEVTIKGTSDTVPLSLSWDDTDGYDSSTAGSYTFTATVGTLPEGYVDEVDTIYEVTVEVVVSSVKSTSSSSSGSGGSSLFTEEEFDNIDFKDYALESVVRDLETTFSFYEENNSIVSLSFTSELNGGQVKALIEVLKDTSSQIDSAAPGDVYKNMNIYLDSNLGDDVIGDRVINFKVEKVWVEENNIDVSFITLCRYNSGGWDMLSTEATGEDEEYYYFTSTTPGFSPFAISSVDPSTLITEASAEKIEATSVDIEQLQSTEDNDASPLESGADLPQKESSSFTYLIIIGLIGLVAIGVVSYRNKDYYEKVRLQLGNPDGKRYRRVKR
jgi:PGF-pre-PGF domain-containing protein